MLWMLDMERCSTRSHIHGDGCGMGKTFTLFAGTIAATRFWQLEADEMRREDFRPSKPTLIVVPDGLEYK